MGCTSCAQDTAVVRIGTGDYCKGCSTRLDHAKQAPAPRLVTTQNGAQKRMDMGSTRRQAPQVSPRLSPGVVAPASGGHVISDVTSFRSAKRVPMPSDSVHARLTSAKGGVLDLRDQGSKPRAARRDPAKASMRIPAAAAYIEPHQAPKLIAPSPDHAFKAERFEDRFDRARSVSRSQAVSKFHSPIAASPAKSSSTPIYAQRGIELPLAATAHHESLTRLLTQLPAVQVPSATTRGSRALAVAGAVVIMSGYVWLQNYPKMAIQSAGDKAGLVASMPAYVPSSYQLSRTSTAPGLVTLQFKTSDQPSALTISQHRTTWDSGSLLDNFVARESSNFAAIQNQGLTVYMFNHNQATWVNHGVWYRITGATRLSREQVLKIAYSL